MVLTQQLLLLCRWRMVWVRNYYRNYKAAAIKVQACTHPTASLRTRTHNTHYFTWIS